MAFPASFDGVFHALTMNSVISFKKKLPDHFISSTQEQTAKCSTKDLA